MIHSKKRISKFGLLYKRSGLYVLSIIMLFLFISIFTSIKPTHRFSLNVISNWTSEIDSSTFLYLLSMENRTFRHAFPPEQEMPNMTSILLQMATSIKLNDPLSLLGQELPGMATFGQQIIIAGEGTNYLTLSVESSPPLEDVSVEREAIYEDEQEEQETEQNEQRSTGEQNIAFIYTTHNRESFLPHLPDVTDPNMAYHHEVNINKVSSYFANALANYGIGAEVDNTDHMSVLHEKNWTYSQSYDASRSIVEEALATNKSIQYVFDLHRDSLPREKTTKVIDEVPYAKILMVVGAENKNYEKNLRLATTFHELINEKYPGLSRGVITKEGPGSNGVYNQDLMDNALLIEMGGYDNTLEELYRTADVMAEIFSDFYWDAQKVDGSP